MTLEELPEPPEWVGGALCAQIDPEIFFPEKGGSTRDAKSVCKRCDVAEQCLAYALEREERFGIWGGKSERERRPLMKKDTSRETVLRRERVAALHAEGLTDVQIASRIGCAPGTVGSDRLLLALPRNRRRDILPKPGRGLS
jgi:hypothetical protein